MSSWDTSVQPNCSICSPRKSWWNNHNSRTCHSSEDTHHSSFRSVALGRKILSESNQVKLIVCGKLIQIPKAIYTFKIWSGKIFPRNNFIKAKCGLFCIRHWTKKVPGIQVSQTFCYRAFKTFINMSSLQVHILRSLCCYGKSHSCFPLRNGEWNKWRFHEETVWICYQAHRGNLDQIKENLNHSNLLDTLKHVWRRCIWGQFWVIWPIIRWHTFEVKKHE